MANPVEAMLILVGACVAAGAIGGSFVGGIALVCRWLKWSPVNITVNVNNYGEAHGILDDVGRVGKPHE